MLNVITAPGARSTPVTLVGVVLLLAVLLSGCGRLTLGGITFGQQRTPVPVITVSNTNPVPKADSRQSQNWAGYAITQFDNITAITATWQVPQVGAPPNSDSSTWVGIGGIQSQTLIQAGTDQLMQNGKAFYYAWIETLPDAPQPVKTIDVLPGDTITVAIQNTGGDTWQVAINDITGGQKITKSLNYVSCRCSAEWIEEAPNINGAQSILAQFTSVTFTKSAATVHGQSLSFAGLHARAIRMVDAGGNALVQPQISTADGFSVVDVSGA